MGRTSNRFKDALRNKVTIVGKTMFGKKPGCSELDQQEEEKE
jgi:hypothetical protein